MPRKTIFFFSLLGILSSTACQYLKNKDFKAGGTCEYITEDFRARIIYVEQDTIQKDSIVRVNHIVHLQTVEGVLQEKTLNAFYDSEFDAAFIQRNKLTEGKILTGKVRRITKGTCKPYYVWFDQAFIR